MEESADKIFVTPNAVIMLDGASAFVPVPVPASTYADYLGRLIADALTTNPSADLTEVLADAIKATADYLELQPGKSPSSTVTIARERDGQLDLLVLGDNLVILPDEIITDDRIDQLDLEPRRKYRERLAAGHGYDDEHRALLRELQTQQAQHRNKPGGYWIAETDPTAAHHAITASRLVAVTPWAILATDGAYNTMEYIGLVTWPPIPGTNNTQLTDILEACQLWERETDPSANELPRAKRHDDKSLTTIIID
jgi:hypothetical protein